MRSQLLRTDISAFRGDALIVPTYRDITNIGKYSGCLQTVIEQGGPDLLREITCGGELEMLHSRLFDGYQLFSKHIIFYACLDDSQEFTLSPLDWHEIWSNVSTLVRIHRMKKIAIKLPIIMMAHKKNFLSRFINPFSSRMSESDTLLILNSIFSDKNPSNHVNLSLFF